MSNNPIKEVKRADIKDRYFIGEVINNDDPNKDKRVQVRVPVLHDAMENDDLPWAVRPSSSLVGSTASVNTFGVPDNGSFVLVEFDDGDIYSPIYFGTINAKNSLKQIPDTSYKDTYGIIDKAGNKIYVDCNSGAIRVEHFSGSFININDTGTLTFNSVEDIIANVTGNVTATVGGNMQSTVGGDMTSTVTGNSTVTCTDSTINASGNVDITAVGMVTVTGAMINLN